MTKSFNDMTGAELVAAYNEMVRHVRAQGSTGLRPVKKFETLVTGIHRCENLRRSIEAGRHSDIPPFLRRYDAPDEATSTVVPPSVRIGPVEDTEEDQIRREADSRWRNWQPAPGCMTRPRRSTYVRQVREEREAAKSRAAVEALSAPAPALSNASRSKKADRIIRILVDANPRRAGSDAHRYFEAMRGGITVGEYLSKFPKEDHRKAAQWLWNTVNENFVRLLP